MRALIWKEYRERRLWVLMLTASAVLIILRGIGYTFVSTGGLWDLLSKLFSAQCMIPMLVALLFGAGAFSSEIDKSAQFLFSQPVSWKKLVAAKLIVGFAVLAASAVLTAVIFRFVCPEQYVRFATPERLGIGVLWAVVLTGVPYLVGVVFSTVLPGAAGGIFVGAVIYALAIVHFAVFTALHTKATPFSLAPWLIAPVVAMLVTARYGLTLQTRDRISRYAITVLGIVGLSVILSLLHLNPERLIPQSWFIGYAPSEELQVSIGPDGSSSLTRVGFRHYLFVGSGHKHAPFWLTSDERLMGFYWPTPNTVIVAGGRNVLLHQHSAWSFGRPGDSAPLPAVSMNGHDDLTAREIKMPAQIADPRILVPSPSGKRYLVIPANYDLGRAVPGSLEHVSIRDTGLIGVLDCEGVCTLRTLPIHASVIWWQSENEIGYLDKQGIAHYETANK